MNAGGAPPEAVLLAGPTASGKTDWALALAERVPLEVVSVDSAQVYRGFDVGSAKPGPEVRTRVPHHLLDIRDPAEAYSAGEFVADALAAIRAIRARGRLPLLVGGTMLYFRALVHGLAALPTAEPRIRRAIDARALQLGWPALHAELAARDPEAARRIHPNDAQRIQRALEVLQSSGRPISDWQRGTAPVHGLRLARWALVPSDRAELARRIEARFEAMLAGGFLEEVRALHARGDLGEQTPSLRAVGYRQLWDCVVGRTDRATAVERAKAATRQLARRQLTWIRADGGWQCVDPMRPGTREQWLEAVLGALRQRGPGPG
ncbi:MAG: tRNA (adenosine(37)-N6)-dimethylallyltransferase MiaA [Steroidobacteraceae bacterium]|jgi:tRNA dimethylallyltransferase|nr:tRNA (adenosine(37)-N6)-dimethylallyltransferase MiaA [Steroidobacteraceae bacterium]